MAGPPPGPYLYSQLFYTPPYPTKKYTGKTILVTGANVGLGFESARHFVRLDAQKVILACRNMEKGEAAKESILKSEKKSSDVIEVWKLDLADYQSVKDSAKKAQSLDRLDVLVENAGIVTSKWNMTEDNESTITTNVVSPMLHAMLLLPKLRETVVKFNTLPRLVFIGSFVHWMTAFPERTEDNIFETLADERKANMDDRYYVSKLLEMYEVQELAELTSKSSKEGQIVVNFTNPGWVKTEAMREWTGLKLAVFKFFCLIFARSTEVGARTTLNAAEGGMETHGQYMNDCQPGQRAPLLMSEEGKGLQKRVWAELAEKLEHIQPGIMQNI